jgi:nucleoside-diphosphate-sugar epimerase
MNRSKKIIVGAGPAGMLTAELLDDAGDDVIVVSRRGTGRDRGHIKHLALDASDREALVKVAAGATTIFNCAMPRYDRWPQEFPPMAAAMLMAAEESGADLVTLSNVYGYGPPSTGSLTESMPLAPNSVKGVVRAKMWEAALASRARVTEVRASDFLGKSVVSYFTWMVLPSIARGLPASFPGDLDALHSWSFTLDVAQTLVAASRSARSWGRAWHVPSNDLSLRALTTRTAQIAGAPEPDLRRMSASELAHVAADDPMMREVMEMTYLFDRPCCLDSTETQQALGVSATPIERVLQETLST